MINAEFHVHTRYSKDSILNKYMILIMCKIRKIKLLAITDHNEVIGAIKYKNFLKKFGVDVIVGEEIMTESGEIIGLYLDKKIPPNMSVKDTIDEIKKQKGLIYLPHPYDEKRYKTVLEKDKQLKYKQYFDFVEVHNGRNIIEKFDLQQEKIQKELGVTRIIGSDAHTFFEIGRNYISIDYKGRDDLIESINNGIVHRAKCIKFAHFVTKCARVITMLEKGDFNGINRIIKKKFKRRRC